MSSCSCSPQALTTVSFGNGAVLVRCGAHDQQQWHIAGEPVDRSTALAALRELFTEQRTHSGRAARPVASRARVIQLPSAVRETSPARSAADAVDDEALTALLNSRGLSGSWAIA